MTQRNPSNRYRISMSRRFRKDYSCVMVQRLQTASATRGVAGLIERDCPVVLTCLRLMRTLRRSFCRRGRGFERTRRSRAASSPTLQ